VFYLNVYGLKKDHINWMIWTYFEYVATKTLVQMIGFESTRFPLKLTVCCMMYLFLMNNGIRKIAQSLLVKLKSSQRFKYVCGLSPHKAT
jgi:hypothetical protein